MKQALLIIPFMFFNLFSTFVSAENRKPDGRYAEASIRHVTCSAIKLDMSPPFFEIRTNRSDIFFDDLTIARKCLGEVKKVIENPKKYKNRLKDYYAANRVFENTRFGEGLAVLCKEMRTAKDMVIGLEFNFPYFETAELEWFTHESVLRTCLLNANPAPSVSWEKSS